MPESDWDNHRAESRYNIDIHNKNTTYRFDVRFVTDTCHCVGVLQFEFRGLNGNIS